jgi:hypothetical protein
VFLFPHHKEKKKLKSFNICVLEAHKCFHHVSFDLVCPYPSPDQNFKIEKKLLMLTRPQNLPQTTNKRGKACAMIDDATTGHLG